MSWPAVAISLAPTLLRQTEANEEAVSREQIEQVQIRARCVTHRRRREADAVRQTRPETAESARECES
jgi:hypothetical protein